MKFKSSQITMIVEDDILNHPCLTEKFLYHILKNLMRKPISKRFIISYGLGFKWLWIVWDGDYKDGIVIVYDPKTERFGLANKGAGKKYGYFIGFYGNFVEIFLSI